MFSAQADGKKTYPERLDRYTTLNTRAPCRVHPRLRIRQKLQACPEMAYGTRKAAGGDLTLALVKWRETGQQEKRKIVSETKR